MTVEQLQLEVARGLARQSLVGVAILDQERFLYVNDRFLEIFGYGREAMLTLPPMETIAYSSRLRVAKHVRECLAGTPHPESLECEAVRRDGSPVYLSLCCSRLNHGDRYYAFWLITDITQQRLAERETQALSRRLAVLTVRDPLTGLYNRRFTEASLERELLLAERNRSPLSLVICDLDHFRSVNEAFGHEAGNHVLRTFGDFLRRRCRKSDIVCRFGGEEFLVVFPGMPAEVAVTWAEKTRAAMVAVRINNGSATLGITASFGVATYPEHGQLSEQLIAAADVAQCSVRAAGGNQVGSAIPSDKAVPDSPCPATTAGVEAKIDDRAPEDLSWLADREG